MTMLRKGLSLLAVCALLLLTACAPAAVPPSESSAPSGAIASAAEIPSFDGETPFVALRDNIPEFAAQERTITAYETYGDLDRLGRCTTVMACIGRELMPTEERGSIGQVKPTGWHTVKYDCVDGKYLYNRCHLIGYQLTGENANERNLITGTRYMNVEGMLPFENMVADYVKETGNHVLYRVTPVFDEGHLLARGVQIEALSVEDEGEGICFNVYVYNNQPGIVIDYATGESHLTEADGSTPADDAEKQTFVVNKNTKKFHRPTCSGAADIKPENKLTVTDTRQAMADAGYAPCKNCQP